MKFSFKNDYSEGCHPKILAALAQSNLSQQNGYGLDEYSLEAENLFKELTGKPEAKVFFVSGGTQANLIVISALLRPHESVISAATGHIFTNETGAIEATGHKVHALETEDGKITPAQIGEVLDAHRNIPHQVKQKLVYISNSTELGTIYSRQELKDLSAFCRANGLLLFMDGARLSHALASEENDLTLQDVAELTDVFYFGGTKNGALLGEAIIISNTALQPEFAFHLKQKGALLAKGRLLGLQFRELLRDDLYLKLARQANEAAMRIKHAFVEHGFTFLTENFTNQLFPVLKNSEVKMLSEKFDFYVWKKLGDDRVAARLITSWATEPEAVEQLISAIKSLDKKKSAPEN